MQPKSVSALARCLSPQKARVLIDAFTRGAAGGRARLKGPVLGVWQAESALSD